MPRKGQGESVWPGKVYTPPGLVSLVHPLINERGKRVFIVQNRGEIPQLL